MTPAEEIAAEHKSGNVGGRCVTCGKTWPCAAIQLAEKWSCPACGWPEYQSPPAEDVPGLEANVGLDDYLARMADRIGEHLGHDNRERGEIAACLIPLLRREMEDVDNLVVQLRTARSEREDLKKYIAAFESDMRKECVRLEKEQDAALDGDRVSKLEAQVERLRRGITWQSE